DPHDDDSPNGIFPGLTQAVGNARPGDTVIIRHSGDLFVDPIQLSKQSLRDLAIRPARRFRPVLVMGETADTDPSLFRLHDGKLRLEGLEFRIRPGNRDFKSLSLVEFIGDGECSLKDCLVTLVRGGETTLALATVGEHGKVMKPDMPPMRSKDQGPRLSLESCFLRGEGDLMTARGNRPLSLDVRDSLATLSGSLIHLEVAGEMTTPPQNQMVRISLSQATTYLGGHLLHLVSTREARGVLPIRCKASNCLFVPAIAGKSLIQLENLEGDDKSLRERFAWEGGQNAYGAYTSLLSQENMEGTASPMSMDKWKLQPGEDASNFGVKISVPPPTLRFSQMEQTNFKVPDSLRDIGAVGKLPRPSR
ncbi:MAG: hypothetical protein ACKO23_12910, partial [Gemmataceae bacterium]